MRGAAFYVRECKHRIGIYECLQPTYIGIRSLTISLAQQNVLCPLPPTFYELTGEHSTTETHDALPRVGVIPSWQYDSK